MTAPATPSNEDKLLREQVEGLLVEPLALIKQVLIKFETAAVEEWKVVVRARLAENKRLAAAEQEALERDAELLNGLLELAGHWQDGSSELIKLHDDDAAREYLVTVGKKTYNAVSFKQAIRAAIAAARTK